MRQPPFSTFTYTVVRVLMPAVFEKLVAQLDRATAALRLRDSRYEIRLWEEGSVCKVTIAAANNAEAEKLWEKINAEVQAVVARRPTGPTQPKARPRANQVKILQALAEKSPQTISEIAKAQGMAVRSAHHAMRRLVKTGIIVEAGLRESEEHRRPAMQYRLADGAP